MPNERLNIVFPKEILKNKFKGRKVRFDEM
jgi:hypothetical protein